MHLAPLDPFYSLTASTLVSMKLDIGYRDMTYIHTEATRQTIFSQKSSFLQSPGILVLLNVLLEPPCSKEHEFLGLLSRFVRKSSLEQASLAQAQSTRGP